MVTKRYGHLAKKETTAALHSVGGDFLNAVNGGKAGDGVVIEHPQTANLDEILLESLRNRHERLALNLAETSPSEGDALSSCATGATENPSKHASSSGVDPRKQASTGQERTDDAGGMAGD